MSSYGFSGSAGVWYASDEVAARVQKAWDEEYGPKEKTMTDSIHPNREQERCFQPQNTSAMDATQLNISEQCDAIKRLLLAKNKKYGNSAANPVRVFAKTDSLDQIAVRCDDKLSRIRNMGGLVQVLQDAKHAEEDTVLDLIGYLILARVVQKEQDPVAILKPRG